MNSLPPTLPVSTVGYLISGRNGTEKILLGTKAPTPKAVKRKIAGKLISYGGDVEPTDKSIQESFKRELAEESGFVVDTADLEIMARVDIYDENGPRLTLFYLFARVWRGEAGTSNEILDPQWYPARRLPDNILEADKIILPKLLSGLKLTGSIIYDKDMKVTGYELAVTKVIE